MRNVGSMMTERLDRNNALDNVTTSRKIRNIFLLPQIIWTDTENLWSIVITRHRFFFCYLNVTHTYWKHIILKLKIKMHGANMCVHPSFVMSKVIFINWGKQTGPEKHIHDAQHGSTNANKLDWKSTCSMLRKHGYWENQF